MTASTAGDVLPILMVALLVTTGLAGCVGSGPATDGSDGDADPTGADDGPGTTPGGSDGDGDPNQTPPGDDDGDANGNDGGSDDGDAEPAPRTPDDAFPDHEPADSGEGWAHYVIDGTTDFSFTAFLLLPSPDQDTYEVPMRVHGDEVLIEVLLTWDQEGSYGDVDEEELMDLNMVVRDDRKNAVNNSNHGQAFVNRFCGHIGECIFIFPPNGEVWEYLQLTPGSGPHADAVPGDWTLTITEQNNWNPDSVAGTAGAGEGSPYRLDVWVYTAEPDATHHPEGVDAET